MKSITALAAISLVLVANNARGDEAAECANHSGTLLTGVAQNAPKFKKGEHLHNIELSHSHVTIKSDKDGKYYDVAIDNVFAPGYDDAGENVPASLASISTGAHLEFCGRMYSDGTGIDWVHTNCGDIPNERQPDGWTKLINADGSVGQNIESSEEHCDIWRHRLTR